MGDETPNLADQPTECSSRGHEFIVVNKRGVSHSRSPAVSPGGGVGSNAFSTAQKFVKAFKNSISYNFEIT